MPGPYRTRAAQLAALRRTVPRYRVPFPDLSVEQRTSPCSNAIAVSGQLTSQPISGYGSAQERARMFPVGYSHKQGLQLITPAQLTNGELQWMSGRKS